MGFVNQKIKAKLTPGIKAVLKKYGMKGTIRVQHYSTLIVTLRSGELDLLGDYKSTYLKRSEFEFFMATARQLDYILKTNNMQVNVHQIDRLFSNPTIKAFLTELKTAMEGDEFYDNSDITTDYVDVSHYISIRIGEWNSPFVCNVGEQIIV